MDSTRVRNTAAPTDRLALRWGALLEDREDWRRPLLQVRNRQKAVGVAGQRARVRVVDTPPLGPVLDEQDQLPQPPVDRRVVTQQRRVGNGQVVGQGDVELGG